MVEHLSFSTNRSVVPDAIPNKILLIGSQFDSKMSGVDISWSENRINEWIKLMKDLICRSDEYEAMQII